MDEADEERERRNREKERKTGSRSRTRGPSFCLQALGRPIWRSTDIEQYEQEKNTKRGEHMFSGEENNMTARNNLVAPLATRKIGKKNREKTGTPTAKHSSL
jgi:hypothetical protein